MNSVKTNNEKNDDEKKGPKLCLLFKTKNLNDILFDFTIKEDMIVTHETIDQNIYYFRRKNSNIIVNFNHQKDIINEEGEILFRARKSKKGYYELIWPIAKFDSLDLDNLKNLDNRMWLVVKSESNQNNKIIYENENENTYLAEGDIIRIGKKKYEIIKLNIISNQLMEKSNKNNNCSIFNLPEKYVFDKEMQLYLNEDGYNPENDCRICFGSDFTEDNPLLKMCKCKTLIHYNCLKLFLKEHIVITNNSYETIYSYKCENFNCEVCQDPYPLKFKVCFEKGEGLNKTEQNEKTFCLIDGLDQPENVNYMILESLTNVKKDKLNKIKNIKNIFIVKLNEREVSIGRSDINDIIDTDSSISRINAVLKYDKNIGKVSIINKGRYGVSILIKKNVKLEKGQKIYFQVGKTYIKAEVKE